MFNLNILLRNNIILTKLFFFVTGQNFILINGITYICRGRIFSSGRCQGMLVPFIPKYNADYCFSRNSYTTVGNYICIGASSVQVINNRFRCYNYDNTPVVVLSKTEFNNMCKNFSQKVQYRYIADPYNPEHVEIPNASRYVHCDNYEPNVCIFSEYTTLGGSNIVTSQVSSPNVNQQTIVSNGNEKNIVSNVNVI